MLFSGKKKKKHALDDNIVTPLIANLNNFQCHITRVRNV